MDDGGCLLNPSDVERVDWRRRYELVLHANPGEKAESRLFPGFQIDVG